MCDNLMQWPALFQNIFKFCTFPPKFLKYFALFSLFFALFFVVFLKNCTHALTCLYRTWHWFLFLCYRERVHENKEFGCGIQNLVMNPAFWPVSQTLHTNFYLSTLPAKINNKVFQNKEKNLFWDHFCPKGIFPKNSG